jgi:hypothetical protein
MRRVSLAALVLAAAVPALAAGALAPHEPPASDLGQVLTHYATVARSDGSFRRMWIDEASLAAARPGAPLPDGTRIAMETFYGADKAATVFIKEKRQGQWLYGSFEPGAPDWAALKSRTVCHSCHIDAEADLTFMLPVIAKFRDSRTPIRLVCAESGRVPCPPALYAGAGAP